MEKPLKTGTVVEIINYGHIVWIHKEEAKRIKFIPKVILSQDKNTIAYDTFPGIVGTITTVVSHTITQGQLKYSLEIGSWYYPNQLRKLSLLRRLKLKFI